MTDKLRIISLLEEAVMLTDDLNSEWLRCFPMDPDLPLRDLMHKKVSNKLSDRLCRILSDEIDQNEHNVPIRKESYVNILIIWKKKEGILIQLKGSTNNLWKATDSGFEITFRV